jgi:hypothetical protein
MHAFCGGRRVKHNIISYVRHAHHCVIIRDSDEQLFNPDPLCTTDPTGLTYWKRQSINVFSKGEIYVQFCSYQHYVLRTIHGTRS